MRLQIVPDFPSLADEIAEPHPDMNINVAGFTVSEKSSYILLLVQKHLQFEVKAESNCNDIMDTNIFYIIQLLPIIEALDMM